MTNLSDYVGVLGQGGIIEGEWTPTLHGATYTPAASRIGGYQRVGDYVHIHGVINWSSLTNDSNLITIGGLPYTVLRHGSKNEATGGVAMVRCEGINFGALESEHNQAIVAWQPKNNSVTMELFYSFSAGSATLPGQSAQPSYNDLATSGFFSFSGHYRATPL